jgi:hypothetical protein
VPRPWLKRLYGGGMQRPKDLARRFDVSESAIETRLSQIGLLGPRPRCSRLSSDWSLQADAGSPRYERAAHPAYAVGV